MSEFEWVVFDEDALAPKQDNKVVYRFHIIEEYVLDKGDLATAFYRSYDGSKAPNFFTPESTAVDFHNQIVRVRATPGRLYDAIIYGGCYKKTQHIVQNVGVKFVKSGGFSEESE